ncbi:hypothetical protein [Xenorhabdus koppenhoeferi]|uniref:Uncharacterized protein n=1 Tax=Xenorhabdus koppenhoeferi TaxID=351659 RepID=A0A1I7HGG9_9GAMM|nr:hypothetical protein [Xenorhabdus koppenhoeferi]SFU59722.1 hypothetical protein SAMN05421784_11421 [Xenorhabdus koppenhoeferi]
MSKENIPNIKYSLKKVGDLIIGQSFPLIITVTTKDPIVKGAYISIENISKNISISNQEQNQIDTSIHIPFKVQQDGLFAEVTIIFFINKNTQYGENITFNINSNIDSFEVRNYKRTAKDINPNSLKLIVDNTYLKSPYPNPDHIASITDDTTKVHATITDETNKLPLSDVPIFIFSMQQSQIKLFFYSYDSKGKIPFPIISFEHRKGFTMNSDSTTGKISFYVHALESLSGRIQLVNYISGIFVQGYAPPIYAIYGGPPSDSTHYTSAPYISGYSPPGYFISNDGETDFLVTIYPYYKALPGDMVFFFVATEKGQPQYSGQNKVIQNPQQELGIPNFNVPYQIFTYGIESQFSYVIVRISGDSLTSAPLPLTYMGGTPYSPDDNVPRDHQTCIVYTSLGIPGNQIIDNNSLVNLTSIEYYPGSPGDGLYIQILGTDNPSTDKDKVPVGTQVTLTAYINSKNINRIKSYDPVEVKLQNDNKIYALINIPKVDLYNIKPIDDWTDGNISLTYEFKHNGKNFYSKIWSAKIETIPR